MALKFLPPELTRDVEARQRFTFEAQSASALEHNHICNVHEIDDTGDGQTIYAHGQGGSGGESTNFWAVSVADGTARPLPDLQNSLKEPYLSLSSDNNRIYFTLWERTGDLWMAELSKNKL